MMNPLYELNSRIENQIFENKVISFINEYLGSSYTNY